MWRRFRRPVLSRFNNTQGFASFPLDAPWVIRETAPTGDAVVQAGSSVASPILAMPVQDAAATPDSRLQPGIVGAPDEYQYLPPNLPDGRIGVLAIGSSPIGWRRSDHGPITLGTPPGAGETVGPIVVLAPPEATPPVPPVVAPPAPTTTTTYVVDVLPAGTTSWTWPENSVSAVVEAWSSGAPGWNCGGNGANWVDKTVTGAPGTVEPVSIGTSPVGSTGSQTGGATWFRSPSTLYAAAPNGGTNDGTPGAGTLASECIGDTIHIGGIGGTVTDVTGTYSSGGGSSATSGGDGVDAAGTTPTVQNTPGANAPPPSAALGGAGSANGNGSGAPGGSDVEGGAGAGAGYGDGTNSPGGTPGGGGGGGGNAATNSGQGGPGQMRITCKIVTVSS